MLNKERRHSLPHSPRKEAKDKLSQLEVDSARVTSLGWSLGTVRRPPRSHRTRSHEHVPKINDISRQSKNDGKYNKLLDDNTPLIIRKISRHHHHHNDGDKISNKYCDFINDFIGVKDLLMSNYLNLLLIFVPLGFIAKYVEWSDTTIFALNFLGMMPLAAILGDATELLADHLGEVIGGLLNATFGNAVEIVVMVIALLRAKNYQDQKNRFDRGTNDYDNKQEQEGKMIVVVQMSLIGSVFSNSLLVLGCSFLANGYYKTQSSFNTTATSANISLLMVAAFVMILPAPYAESSQQQQDATGNKHAELLVSRATAIVLLLMYASLIVFVLYTHKHLIDEQANENEKDKELELKNLNKSIKYHNTLEYGSDNDMTKNGSTNITKKSSDIENQKKDIDVVIDSNNSNNNDNDDDDDEPQPSDINKSSNNNNGDNDDNKDDDSDDDDDDDIEMSIGGSMSLLLITTVLVALMSEYLVGSIEGAADNVGMSEAFIGLILLPIIGNAVEHLTAVRMAMKNKMDIALSIAIGSATQVAMFVVGLAVLIGWALKLPMKLDFDTFEVQMFIYTSIIIFALVADGTSNWLSGFMLLALYILIAIAVWDQKFDWKSYA